MFGRVIEGVVSAIVICLIAAFAGLFIHVQALDTGLDNVKQTFKYIKADLDYIREKVDHLYERK